MAYGTPPIVAVPSVARTSPSRIRRVVVFPAPFGPRKPVTRPGSTRALKESTAVTTPKRLVTAENSSNCPSGMANPLVVMKPFPLSLRIVAPDSGKAAPRRPRRCGQGRTIRGNGSVAPVSVPGDGSEQKVLVRASGSLGRLTLNRPRSINALDLDMIRSLSAALDDWEHDTDIDTVLLDGAGERGLCAGGDVRGLYERTIDGAAEESAVFFREEYALNARIAEYPKPFVAFADGITMGGGIGLAGHAPLRIVTERSQLAMPETRIGFTPDVGGTWLLSRAPGRLGEYLGLTGQVMDASDAIYAGFADHFVPSAHLDGLREALQTRADPSNPAELVLLFDETPPAVEAAGGPRVGRRRLRGRHGERDRRAPPRPPRT